MQTLVWVQGLGRVRTLPAYELWVVQWSRGPVGYGLWLPFIKRPYHSQACVSGLWKKLGGRVWKERPPQTAFRFLWVQTVNTCLWRLPARSRRAFPVP